MIDYEKYHRDGYAFFRIEDLLTEEQLIEFNKMADIAYQTPLTPSNFFYVYAVQGKYNDPEWPFKLSLYRLEEKLKLSKELGHRITQKWYEGRGDGVRPIMEYYNKLTSTFIRNFYPEIKEDCSNLNYQSAITVYMNGDFTQSHRDGQNQGRLCVILIYLTPEEEYNNGGGELVVFGDNENEVDNNAYLKPVRGNVAMLDFNTHNPFHEVKEIINNFRRYCYISFLWNVDKMPDSNKPQGYK
jgi:hypothetical protein